MDTPPNERKWLLLSATLPHDDKISLTEKQGQENGHCDGLHISGKFLSQHLAEMNTNHMLPARYCRKSALKRTAHFGAASCYGCVICVLIA